MAVQPQDERVSVQKRLNERSKSVTVRLLNDLGMGRTGRDIGKLFPKDARGKKNSDALIILMAIAVNEFMDIPEGKRKQAPVEKLRSAFDSLDVIGDGLVQKIRAAIK